MSGVAEGIIGAVAAAVFWGSNYIVTKSFTFGDGIIFQYHFCTGVLLVGVITLFFAPPGEKPGDFSVLFSIYPLIGGAMWALGNIVTVPVINRIGLAIGLSVWVGVANITSFIIGQIGVFGIKPEVLRLPWLGILGVLFGVVGLGLFTFVKPEVAATKEEALNKQGAGEIQLVVMAEGGPMTASSDSTAGASATHKKSSTGSADGVVNEGDSLIANALSAAAKPDGGVNTAEVKKVSQVTDELRRRFEGLGLATFAGLMYGVQFVPMVYWQQNHPIPAGESNITYQVQLFFSQFVGSFLLSCVCLILVSVFMKVPDRVEPRSVTPSMVSGIMWALAACGSMVASSPSTLGLAVGYVISTNGAFIVNAVWNLAVFKEVKNPTSVKFFLGAIFFVLISCISLVLSKS